MSLTAPQLNHPLLTKIHESLDAFIQEKILSDPKVIQAQNLVAKITELEAQAVTKVEELHTLLSEYGDLGLQVETSRTLLEGYETKIQAIQKDLTALDEQKKTATAELASLQSQIEQLKLAHQSESDKHEALVTEHSEITTESESAKSATATAIADRDAALANIETIRGLQEDELETHTRKIGDLIASQNTLILQNKELEMSNHTGTTAKEALEAETKAKQAELTDLNDQVYVAKQELSAIELNQDAKLKEVSDGWTLLNTEKQLFESTKKDLADKGVMFSTLKNQISELLAKALETFSQEDKLAIGKLLNLLSKF